MPVSTVFENLQDMNAAAKTQIPTLMVAGALDKQVSPDNVRNLNANVAAPKKIFVDLGCSSHMAMW